MPVPAGPLAVKWHWSELPAFRAGAAHTIMAEVENAGTARWPAEPGRRIAISYHWLDDRRNPIVWEGHRTSMPRPVDPGERVIVEAHVRAPTPPGSYRLAIDLIDEGRCWFSEIGNACLEAAVEVGGRLNGDSVSIRFVTGDAPHAAATIAAFAQQGASVVDDGDIVVFLRTGVVPTPGWVESTRELHRVGYGVVSGGLEVGGPRRLARPARATLAPWVDGEGRAPNWNLALLCPSVLREATYLVDLIEPVAGLPAIRPTSVAQDTWVLDRSLRLRVDAAQLPSPPRRASGRIRGLLPSAGR